MTAPPRSQTIRRCCISALLLILVAVAATVMHLILHHNAWVEHGESPLLWDWAYILLNSPILFAVAQYAAVTCVFTLAWVLWHSKWRVLRNLLIAWGITWLPVAITSTGDVTVSTAGPFNFPMAMFAAPLFAFFCLQELCIAILIQTTQRSHCRKKAEELQVERQARHQLKQREYPPFQNASL